MNWYKKASIQKYAWKFVNPDTGSFVCGYCETQVSPKDVVENTNHQFPYGQMHECQCGKSKIWTNSIRFPKELVQWVDGEEVPTHLDPEYYGFCNDIYCGFCLKPSMHPSISEIFSLDGKIYHDYDEFIKDFKAIGSDPERGVRVDKYHCTQCDQNQNVLKPGNMNFLPGGHEGQSPIAHWYKNHQDLWRNKIRNELV